MIKAHRLFFHNLTNECYVNSTALSVEYSRKYMTKSTEFSWGYLGSGPAQLAFAILFRMMHRATDAMDNYFHLKEKFISQISGDNHARIVLIFGQIKDEVLQLNKTDYVVLSTIPDESIREQPWQVIDENEIGNWAKYFGEKLQLEYVGKLKQYV